MLLGQQQAGQSSRQAAIMLAECSLVMLGVNAMLFITSLLEKISARILMAAELMLAVIGLVVLAADRSDVLIYLGGGRRSDVDLRQTALPVIGAGCEGQLMQETYCDARERDHHPS